MNISLSDFKLSKVEFMIEYLLERRPKGQGQRFVLR